MTNLPRIILSLVIFLVGCSLAYAHTVPTPESMAAQAAFIVKNMEGLKGSLQLTDDQEAQMRAILEGNVKKMSAVLQQHGVAAGAKLSIEKKASLAHDLKPIRNESDKKLATILSPEQMSEFEKIRKEASNEVKAGGK